MGWQEDLHNLEVSRARNGGRTPAPWHWEVHDSSAATLCGGGLDAMVGPIMTVGPCSACYEGKDEWQWGRCQTPSKADATLMAAAPDLLAAAQFLDFDWINHSVLSDVLNVKLSVLGTSFEAQIPIGRFRQLRAAIAKAEGAVIAEERTDG